MAAPLLAETLLAALFTSAGDAAAAPPAGAPAAGPNDPIPVLIVTGANNHDWQYTTTRIRESLEECGRFAVDVTEKPAQALGDAKGLAKYQALVLNYNGPRWGEPAESNFLAAVAGGTGVSVIHAADNAFPGWTEYEKLVGDLWREGTSHGAYHPFTVRVVDREHPITHEMPDLEHHPDELYHLLVHTDGVERRVLASAWSAPDQGGTGEDEPMVIVQSYGKGRVFHTPLGHVWSGVEATHATWNDAHLRLLVARGTEWAATGNVTIPPVLPNELTRSERLQHFQLLFDGRTTAGWRGFKKQAFPDSGWEVADGALHAKAHGGGGDIVTLAEFGDFDLRFDWKVAAGSNSGVMYRTGEEADAPYMTAPEYQVLDDAKHEDGKEPKTSAAALYGLYACQNKVLKPVGQWNEGRIVVAGNHVEHWLNGVKVLSAEFGSDDWKQRVAASKFAAWPLFATKAKGHIDLQDHGDEVWYSSIRIRELPPQR
jgi:type 1 glutamine amidotransferase